jgi:hypothetical protein
MDASGRFHGPLKAAAVAVLVLMALAMGWGAYVSLTHWSGIGV